MLSVFQSTHPSGVRLNPYGIRDVAVSFQSTHPSGVRLRRMESYQGVPCNFNPRTPVGCDGRGGGEVAFLCIFQSTHPSGVRLARYTVAEIREMISIHAPQWGATRYERRSTPSQHDFNPRTPVGCDFDNVDVSTESTVFQSTHPSGVRHYRQTAADLNALFQSTHPSGVRPPSCWPCRPSAAYFNPRTPVGCCFCSIGS